MGKAILAAIVTLIVGYLGMVVGLELLGNWVEFGLLIAIAVMGAFIIYFNDKNCSTIATVFSKSSMALSHLSP